MAVMLLLERKVMESNWKVHDISRPVSPTHTIFFSRTTRATAQVQFLQVSRQIPLPAVNCTCSWRFPANSLDSTLL
jgi:hypothetical protein